ncbi:protein-glutamine gamma-glutamyltransferase E-like [Ascaphus truei]|uniref:protein-glutamine gamma-glutamyltransferase E-like n=1 Tax=Ascaphus truei TaxID=8439 RepID=UPI003F59051E
MAALQVTSSDLQLNANKTAHNCSSYLGRDLILRRGQEFTITLTFNTSVTAGDKLQFAVKLVTASAGSSLLEYNFSDSSALPSNSWAAKRGENGSNSMTVTFTTPSNAVIGRYNLQVQTSGGSRRIGDFYLLFNPWARGDVVYLEDKAQREEYVLSEFGLIYLGEEYNPGATPWDYGQFQDNILNISLALLDSTLSFRRNPSEDVRRRNDPIHVCRVLSAIINSKDDRGVVLGSWIGEYSEGTNPNAWTGSAKILRSWFEQKQPVKYGQCWVFAGVVCTVGRALGLPCRVITNFHSAHDTDRNLSIESYYDESGETVNRSDDSVWNFHCWNESWFLRPDLGDLYNGWQIWDATPQEMSDGIFQLGPTSQRAVKEGDINKLYDTQFVYSEVNADVINLIEHPDGRTTRGATYSGTVGKLLCTKAVGSNTMNDVTLEYKYEEGTSREREMYNKALRFTSGSTGFVSMSAAARSATTPSRAPDVSGKIAVVGTPTVGKDISVILTLENLTSQDKNVTANLNASAIVYNRAVRRPILTQSLSVALGPKKAKQVPLQITYSQYEKALTTDNLIHVTSVCHVENWGELFVETNITLQKPPIQIQALGPAVLGKPVTVVVIFTNPLSEPVTNCFLTAEGSGLTKEGIHKDVGALQPQQKISVTLDILPYVTGVKYLLVNLTCNKFNDIKGFLVVTVGKASS